MSDSPRTVQELNVQLADTIGAAVEQLMGMSGYSEADNSKIDAAINAARRESATGSGQPDAGGGSTKEPAALAGQPGTATSAPAADSRPQAPATAPEGDIDWEATKAPNGLYLGKYKTRQEAVRGVANTVAMAKVAFDQRDQVLARNTELQRELETLRTRPAATPAAAPQDSPASSPSQRETRKPSPKLDAVLSKLNESGNLDEEDLKNLVGAISEHTEEVARKVAVEVSDERTAAERKIADRWAKVEEFMVSKYPDSANLSDELALFTKSHPVIAAGVQALIAQDRHEEATEQAWLAFTRMGDFKPSFKPAPATKENVEKEIRLDAANDVRKEAVEAARKDAGIIGATGAHGVHENANSGPTPDEYDAAVAEMHSGNGARWRNLVFGPSLNHPLFDN